MKSLALSAGLLAMAIVPAACTATSSGGSSAGMQMVSVSPALKAEIRGRGLDPDEEICKREEQMGSTIPRNICATRAEWEAKSRASKDGTRDIQNNALRTRDPNAGG